MDYYSKYLKYKNKFISLKNQNGLIECNDSFVLHNKVGTCWNASIQMILLFGNITSNEVQENLINLSPNNKICDILYNKDLYECLPIDFFINDDYNTKKLKDDVYVNIIDLLKEHKTRFAIKQADFIEEHTQIAFLFTPKFRRQNSAQCEINFTKSFFNLINVHKKKYGGKLLDQFLLVLILGIFTCKKKIDFIIYKLYNDLYIDYTNPLNLYYKQGKIDIEIARNSIGILVHLNGHMTALYKCVNKAKCVNEYKYYDSANINYIVDFNWILFFEKINELIENKSEFCIYQIKNNFYNGKIFNSDSIGDVKDIDIDEYELKKKVFLSQKTLFIISKTDNKLYYLNNNVVDSFSFTNTMLIINDLNKYELCYKFGSFCILNFSTLTTEQYKNKYMSLYLDYYIKNKNMDYSKLVSLFSPHILNNKNILLGKHPLMLAIKDKNTNLAICLIKEIDNVDIIDYHGNSILLLACKNGYYRIAKQILKKSKNANFINKLGESALSYAIKDNKYNFAKKILSKINIMLDNLSLCLAIENMQFDLAKDILLKSENVDFINKNSNTPLDLAIKIEQYDLAIKIATKCKNVNYINKSSTTPISPLLMVISKYELSRDKSNELIINLIKVIAEKSTNKEERKDAEEILKIKL